MNSLLYYLGAMAAIWALARIGSPRLYFLVSFPGLLLHELAHYGAALLTGGKPEAPDLAPRRQGDGSWLLGSVRFSANTWNGVVIGLAPLSLLLGVWALGWYAQDEDWRTQLGAGYLGGCLLWGAWPSRQDWAIALTSPAGLTLLLLLGLGGGYYLAG